MTITTVTSLELQSAADELRHIVSRSRENWEALNVSERRWHLENAAEILVSAAIDVPSGPEISDLANAPITDPHDWKRP